MATTTDTPPTTLERFKQFDAVSLLLVHLVEFQGDDEYGAPPFEGLLDEAVIGRIGDEEFTELYGGTDESPHDGLPGLENDILMSRLFARLACSSEFCAERAEFFLGRAQRSATEIAAAVG